MVLSLPRIHKKRQGNKERSRTFSRPHISLGIALQVSTPFPTAAIRCCSGERGSLRHVVPSCPSPAPTAPHWGESRGQMSFENQFPAHSLAAQSSNFEGRGEQLHISCFSCRCDLARHVLVPPQSSSLSTEGAQPRPSIWCCVWRHATDQNRLVFNWLLSILKICTLIIHLIYLGWHLPPTTLVCKDLIVSWISDHHERALGKNSSSFPLLPQ